MWKLIVDENLFSALKIAIQKLNDQEGRQVFFRPACGAWSVCAGNYANNTSNV